MASSVSARQDVARRRHFVLRSHDLHFWTMTKAELKASQKRRRPTMAEPGGRT
jgi:hypothetical protein